jgi:2-amino-4-hydroxy-6-hydroxymethyldihydropteridine diphosphokinase
VTILALNIGSNINAQKNIRLAVSTLRTEFGELNCSKVYESEAVGFEGDNFLNLVVTIETKRALRELQNYLKKLEDKLGRDRTQVKFSGRTMDIDILTYESDDDSNIELPRAEITENAFVLQPLAELLPDELHDKSGLTYAVLWQAYDKSAQRLWPSDFDWQGD